MSFLTLVLDDINAVNAINAIYVFFGMEDEFNGCENITYKSCYPFWAQYFNSTIQKVNLSTSSI